MRRIWSFIMVTIYLISLCACSQSSNRENIQSWDCTITYAEASSDEADVISYSDEKIVSAQGVLTLENRNDFDIVVHLLANGTERVEKIEANAVTVLHQISKDTEYTLGCYAEVSEGTEIQVFVYDGANNKFHSD